MTQPTRPLLLVSMLALTLLLGPGRLAAAEGPLEAVETNLAAVEQEIGALEKRVTDGLGAPQTVALIEQLRNLELTYLRQREVLLGDEQLRKREQEGEQRLASGPSGQLAQPPPYVLAVLDALADARDAQRQHSETVGAALESAQQAKIAADAALERAEQARRRDAEAAEGQKNEVEAARLRLALQGAVLEIRGARARQELAALEVTSLERKLALQLHDAALLEDTVRWVRANLALDESVSDASLGDREFAARRALEEAEHERSLSERTLSRAEKRLEGAPTSAVRLAELAARRAELELWQRRVEVATTTLSRIEAQRAVEERRVKALAGETPRVDLLEWKTELEAERAETERNLRLVEVQRGEIQSALAAAKASVVATEAAAKPWIERQVGALEAVLALHAEDSEEWKRFDTLTRRVLTELDEITKRPSLLDRVGDLSRAAEGFWQFELIAVDERPITIGKIATALLLFGVGFAVARLVSSLLGRLLVWRMSLATGAASAIQSLLFYVLLVLFALAALRSVNIPLTVFTVLGGALAIGVGFGSQNIVNNFISGLILLAERPIKMGDIIEIDGQRGTVEGIGARSTRVRTFDNIHIIVPNSAFLEKNVVNWTLADDDVRTRVEVGVAYGSPTRDVERLLLSAVQEHDKVLAHPAPIVHFIDFGDNSLMFRTSFWIRSRNMSERLTVESDVRYRIDELCREAGITIAFPQRDVHLDIVAGAVPVRVVQTEE